MKECVSAKGLCNHRWQGLFVTVNVCCSKYGMILTQKLRNFFICAEIRLMIFDLTNRILGPVQHICITTISVTMDSPMDSPMFPLLWIIQHVLWIIQHVL